MNISERIEDYMKNRKQIEQIRAEPRVASEFVPWFLNNEAYAEVISAMKNPTPAPFDPIAASFASLPIGLDPFARADALADPSATTALPDAPGGDVTVQFVPGTAPDAAAFGAALPPVQRLDESRVHIADDRED